MAAFPSFFDRVKMGMASAPGTGAITLGAAISGYRSFDAAGVADGALVSYVIEDGANYEFGHGTYTKSGTSLARSAVFGSSNSGSAINASANATVFLSLLAADVQSIAGVTPTTLVAARYWRIDNLLHALGASFGFVGTGELQFFDSTGTLIPSSNPFSNGHDSDPLSNINDGNLGSYWTTSSTDGSGFAGLDLGQGAAPCSVLISSRNGNKDCDISSFGVSYSNDKSNWTVLKSNLTPGTWTGNDNQTQTFGLQGSGLAATPLQFPICTLSILPPSGKTGQALFVTDGRKSGEAAGAGTGVLAIWSNSAWRRPSDDTAVVN